MIVVPPVVPSGAAGGQRFCYLCDWSDACVCQFFCQFSEGSRIGLVLVSRILPVLGRFASFETGVATKLARTFRWNSNVLPPIWPIGQFCFSCQKLSKFSIYIASIGICLVFDKGSCTCGSSLLVALVGGAADGTGWLDPYRKFLGSGISACTIDRVANIDHNEGDGTSIFWTIFSP